MEKNDYDLIVIGGGPAGYPAAIRAAQLGKKTGVKIAVIEKRQLGGTCLHRGCIPSKAGLHVAELYSKIQEAESWGISVEGLQFDWSVLVEKRAKILSGLEKGIHSLFKAYKIDLIQGSGTLISASEVKVNQEIYRANKIIIAAGSIAGRPDMIPFNPDNILTSEEVFQLADLPKSMAILGAGPEGCEWACMFQGLGVDVGLIEFQDRILPGEEPVVSKELAKIFKKRKVGVFTNTKIESIEVKAKDWVRLEFEDGEHLEVNCLIVATGRRPNFSTLIDRDLDLDINERGFIQTDAYLQTSLPGVYAVGDINGQSMLAHSATRQACLAVAHALGQDVEQEDIKKFDPQKVPGVIFTYPEIARIGPTEAELKRQGYKEDDIKVGRFAFIALGKAQAIGETEGQVQLLCDAKNDRILSCSIIGANASDIIHEAALAIDQGLTAQQLAQTIHAHPTLSEALAEAAEDVHGQAIHRVSRK